MMRHEDDIQYLLYLPKGLHRQYKILAAENGITIRDLIITAMQKFVREENNNG
jgi:hypothetical protein